MPKRLTAGVLALAVAFLLAGTGLAEDKADPKPEKDTPEQFMKDAIKLMNDTADVLETIKDKDSAVKVKPKLLVLAKASKEIEKRGKKLKIESLPKEEQEALQKKYNDAIQKAFGRLIAVMGKLNDPEVKKILQDVQKEAQPDEKKEDKKDGKKEDKKDDKKEEKKSDDK
jgi:hypothetical protein